MPIPRSYIRKDHRVYSLIFHLIFVSKYRQKVFQDGIGIVEDINETLITNVTILDIECGIDPVHLLSSTSPNIELTRSINYLKGSSSRYIWEKYVHYLRDKLWGDHFLNGSYFIASTGRVSIDILKVYIETQRGAIGER